MLIVKWCEHESFSEGDLDWYAMRKLVPLIKLTRSCVMIVSIN